MNRSILIYVVLISLLIFVFAQRNLGQDAKDSKNDSKKAVVTQAEEKAETKTQAQKNDKSKKDKKDTKEDEKKTLSDFMREKLKASNNILEGLTVEDYDLIMKGAKSLEKLTEAGKWRASNDAMYRHHSVEFRRVVKKMKEAAEKKDLDAAALAWVSTTMSCIECHKYVRTILVTGE